MKTLTSLLAVIAMIGSATLVEAQAATPPLTKDDCEKQENKDKDACIPFLPVAGGAGVGAGAAGLGGLGAGGIAAVAGIGVLVLGAAAGGGSGGHSGSH